MDSYLVRIYRKEQDNPRMLVGIVKQVGGQDKKAFSTLHELWSILNPIKKDKPRRKKERSSKAKPDGMSP